MTEADLLAGVLTELAGAVHAVLGPALAGVYLTGAADPDYLRNGWGQPHEVLTRCRLLFTATRAEVTGKSDAARWSMGVVPEEWHDLIDRAVATGRTRPSGCISSQTLRSRLGPGSSSSS